jgi:hypothetical protein
LGSLIVVGLFLTPKPAVAIVGAFLVLQPLLVNLAGGVQNSLGGALHRVHEVAAVAAGVRVLIFLAWRPLAVRLRPWVALVGVFLSAGLVSAMLQQVPIFTALLGAFLAIKIPLFFLMALTVDWHPRDARWMVRGLLILGLGLLATGVLWLILPPDAMQLFNEPGAGAEDFFARGGLRSMQAPFAHPGTFGWAMSLIGCYAIAHQVTRPGLVGSSTLVASVMGIVGSLRRKPLVAFPVAALVGGLTVGSRRHRWAIVGLLVVLIAGTLGFGMTRLRTAASDAVTGYLDPYAPTTARALLYATGWRIGVDRFPLGAGFGRFGGYASELDYSPVYDDYGLSGIWGLSRAFPNYIEDTYWPHILGETGFVGLSAMLVLLFGLWLRALRAARRSGDQDLRVLALGASMALIEALVESIVSPGFEVSLPAFALAVPLGMVVVLDAPGTSERLE